MDSSLNYRHVQVHSADLHRRGELHRLAAAARASKREDGPAGQSRFHLISLAALRSAAARVNAAAHTTAALGSKMRRA
jgi:hypothetical protein